MKLSLNKSSGPMSLYAVLSLHPCKIIISGVLQSAAVLGTVLGVLILFIPLCLLCRYLDKKDKIKVSLNFLVCLPLIS